MYYKWETTTNINKRRSFLVMYAAIRNGIYVILSLLLISCGGNREEEINSKLDTLINPYAETGNFSGSILVAKGDNIVYQKSFGFANVEHKVPNTDDTRFYIASVTKSFTSTAIFLLEEEGLLNIEDPVSRFIPEYPNGNLITIRHLLTHTSGLPRIVFFPDYWKRTLQPATSEEVVKYFQDKPLASRPSESHGYSNANYALLGHIIELIAGMTYGEFITTRLLEPLGMENSGFPKSMMEVIPKLAFGYEAVGEKDFAHASHFDRSWHIGSASIYSTPEDLLTWVLSVINNKVLKPETTTQMFDIKFGCGWNCSERYGRNSINLSGWDNLGFSSAVSHFPDDSLTVVVLGNLDIISVTNEISDGITAIMLNEDYEPLHFSDETLDTGLSNKIVGVYKWGDDFYVPGATIEIFENDGRLFSKAGEESVGILRISELEFIHRMSWARMKFELDDDGEIREMLYYGRFKAVKQ